MGPEHTDFVDHDYQSALKGALSGIPTHAPRPADHRPAATGEELAAQLSATQQQLVRLRESQEQLERMRNAVEELRRRRCEFETGREEMRDQLSRGVSLLEKLEFNARRDAEQIARTLEDLRASLKNVESIEESAWTEADIDRQLSRALASVHDARMEWNSARLKWPQLDGLSETASPKADGLAGAAGLWTSLSLGRLCLLGLALTWPLALATLAALGIFMTLLFRH